MLRIVACVCTRSLRYRATEEIAPVKDTRMPIDMTLPALVVEPSREVSALLQQILMSFGFSEVNRAADGSAALRMLAEHEYGLVTTAWHMVPMGGAEFIRQSSQKFEAVPIVVIASDESGRTEGQSLGAKGFVRKGFRAQELWDVLTTL
jgi:two-component system, chemotaxis family, chemotaxis protein CheY